MAKTRLKQHLFKIGILKIFGDVLSKIDLFEKCPDRSESATNESETSHSVRNKDFKLDLWPKHAGNNVFSKSLFWTFVVMSGGKSTFAKSAQIDLKLSPMTEKHAKMYETKILSSSRGQNMCETTPS